MKVPSLYHIERAEKVNNSNNGAGGLISAGIVVLGILMLAFGSGSGPLAALLHLIGIACVGIGIVVAIIVAVIIAVAFKTSKATPEQEAKMEVNKIIAEKKQQVGKLKSEETKIKMTIHNLQDKIETAKRTMKYCQDSAEKYLTEGNEARAREELVKKEQQQKNIGQLEENMAYYEKSLAEVQKAINDMENDTIGMENRRDNAVAKIRIADARNTSNEHNDAGNNNAISELEKEAQYKEDVTEALEQLKASQRRY